MNLILLKDSSRRINKQKKPNSKQAFVPYMKATHQPSVKCDMRVTQISRVKSGTGKKL
jgi:hypothetical protein